MYRSEQLSQAHVHSTPWVGLVYSSLKWSTVALVKQLWVCKPGKWAMGGAAAGVWSEQSCLDVTTLHDHVCACMVTDSVSACNGGCLSPCAGAKLLSTAYLACDLAEAGRLPASCSVSPPGALLVGDRSSTLVGMFTESVESLCLLTLIIGGAGAPYLACSSL